MEEEELTDAELREITRRKKEDIKQARWTPGKVEDTVGGVLKEDYEKGKKAREKSKQYAKGRKARKDKNKRKLPKDKYTMIPNEFIETVSRQYLKPNESKVLWHLVRKTWGWGKEFDFMALKQFTKELSICKVAASQALTRLKHRRIVNQLANKTYGIQADTSLWRDKPKKKRVKKRVENS